MDNIEILSSNLDFFIYSERYLYNIQNLVKKSK